MTKEVTQTNYLVDNSFMEVRYILLALAKGQLISKCLFGFFIFFQKTNEDKSTRGFIVVGSNVGNVGLKKSFQLCLPLTTRS